MKRFKNANSFVANIGIFTHLNKVTLKWFVGSKLNWPTAVFNPHIPQVSHDSLEVNKNVTYVDLNGDIVPQFSQQDLLVEM